ncbi:MAG: peptidoglycan-binding domain-containing protein [Ilumatobacter sp.]|uniref:peptidoglycan-binding domain-containing protein n=1 Tax=Ilumatobacter sp. TaxID=1967498 RepID=UPI00329719CB
MKRALIPVLMVAAACSSTGDATQSADVPGATTTESRPIASSSDATTTQPAQSNAATSVPPLTVSSSTPPPDDDDTSATRLGVDTIEFIEVTLQDPPPFPRVDGYEAVGEPTSQSLRLFDDGIPVTYGTASVNRCGEGVWVSRWRVLDLNPVPIVATRAPGGLALDPVASDLPPAEAGFRGHLGGSQCEVPAFYLQTPGSGNLVDVLVEYQRYEISVNEPGVTDTPVGQPSAPIFTPCSTYEIAFDLPLRQCSEGRTVRYAQEQLAERGYLDPLAVDGLYGADTASAVFRFQQDANLVADGTIGTNTWNLLLVGVGLPGIDLNGDDVIQPDELGE